MAKKLYQKREERKNSKETNKSCISTSLNRLITIYLTPKQAIINKGIY